MSWQPKHSRAQECSCDVPVGRAHASAADLMFLDFSQINGLTSASASTIRPAESPPTQSKATLGFAENPSWSRLACGGFEKGRSNVQVSRLACIADYNDKAETPWL